jgi:hypothetical protein
MFQLLGKHILEKRAARAVASGVIGLVLVGLVAGPASAAPPPTSPTSGAPLPAITPITTTPPALVAFTTLTSIGAAQSAAGSPAAAVLPTASPSPVSSKVSASALVPSSAAATVSVIGKRQTFTRGGALAWSSDSFEWYWTGSKLTSSTAWQADGYIFPNTVTLMGIKRTLETSTQHLWRGTAAIGAGIVTPWGAVNVYSTTMTDYFTLTPGKMTQSD